MSAYPETISEIVDAYPRLYSERRFHEWLNLFDKGAVMGRAGSDGNTWVVDIEQSARNQEGFANGKTSFHEKWDNVKASCYGNIAVVIADYVLEADGDIRNGTDALLLVRCARGWKIAALVYDEHKV